MREDAKACKTYCNAVCFYQKKVFPFIESFKLPGFGFLILTFLSSIVSDEKLAIIWIIDSLYIIFFFFPVYFQVSSVFVFQGFDHDVSMCDFLCLYPPSDSLSF